MTKNLKVNNLYVVKPSTLVRIDKYTIIPEIISNDKKTFGLSNYRPKLNYYFNNYDFEGIQKLFDDISEDFMKLELLYSGTPFYDLLYSHMETDLSIAYYNNERGLLNDAFTDIEYLFHWKQGQLIERFSENYKEGHKYIGVFDDDRVCLSDIVTDTDNNADLSINDLEIIKNNLLEGCSNELTSHQFTKKLVR